MKWKIEQKKKKKIIIINPETFSDQYVDLFPYFR